MDTLATINIKAFFQTVRSGSLNQLKQLLIGSVQEEKSCLANSFYSEGETPLMVAIKENHYEMVRFLVLDMKANIYQLGRFYWKGLDFEQVPPLFGAVVCCTDKTQEVICFLIEQDLANNCTPRCYVDVIMSDSTLTQSMKANVLKLLGASYLTVFIMEDPEKYGKSCDFAVYFWSAATSVRLDEVSTSPATIPLPNQNSEWAQKVIGNVSEFTTLGELEEIYNRPKVEYHLETQALLIIQRVMSEIHHPDPSIPFFSFASLHYGFLLKLNMWYDRAIVALMLSVESLRAREWIDAINSEWPFGVVNECLWRLLDCLIIQNGHHSEPDISNRLQFPTIMEAFRCFSSFHSNLLIHRVGAKCMVEIMVRCINNLPLLNAEESEEFMQWLSSYIGDIERHPHVYTLLHEVCRFYSLNDMIPLLLHAGARPFATDAGGDSPLHYLTLAFIEGKYFDGTLVRFLLRAGAYLNQRNGARGVTPLMNLKPLQLILAPNPYLDSLCNNTVFPLQGFCAQVIRENQISFDHLPPTLKSLILKH